jgi:enoyl-CoA hydratase
MGGAEKLGLVLKAVPADQLDREVDALARRIGSVPQNQLMMQKLMLNGALTNMGLQSTQMMATLFDGIARHTREGLNFKRRAAEAGWKQAVEERDQGSFDWTRYEPLAQNR